MKDNKKSAGSKIAGFFKWIGNDIKEIGVTFKDGDWKTRLSFVIMGFGPLMRKLYARGIAFLTLEILFFYYLFSFGLGYLVKFGTLGTQESGWSDTGLRVYGDNSFLILLYGLLTIIIIVGFIFLWRMNVHENYREEQTIKQGHQLKTNRQDLHSLLDSNFDKTLLALPVLGIFVFTVLPIIFMICVSFTNYDYNHQAPTRLFTWVGLKNFKELVSFGSAGFGSTFFKVLIWTLVWALFATFLNYFLGMAVAILINKKGIKFKNGKSIRKQIYPLNFFLKHRKVSLVLTTIFILFLSIINMNGINYIKDNVNVSTFIEDNYVMPNNNNIVFEKKNNLILIFAESFETTLFSKEEGGEWDYNVMPEMYDLLNEEDSIYFASDNKIGGVNDLFATTWTTASIVANTSGLPFKIPIDGNKYHSDDFMNGAYALGDVLKDNEYYNEVISAANMSFGGLKEYYTKHGL